VAIISAKDLEYKKIVNANKISNIIKSYKKESLMSSEILNKKVAILITNKKAPERFSRAFVLFGFLDIFYCSCTALVQA
jgi:hypothetical protein